MKSYTDIEQSKKLAEILPLESADLWYAEIYEGKIEGYNYIVSDTPYYSISFTKPSENNYSQNTVKDIPCWSLAALLGYLNQDWYVYLSHDGICWQCVIDHHDRKERHCSNVLTDEPVDCCVDLIVKLKEEENLI